MQDLDLDGSILFEPFRLDTAGERLLRGDIALALTPRAFAVLRFLAERSGRLVTKGELLDSVWAGTHVRDAVLKVCVLEIRKALGDSATQPRFIETVQRRGYRFVGGAAARGAGSGAETGFPAGRTGVEALRQSFAVHPSAGLVGRDRETTFLKDRLEAALRGTRQSLFVTGEPGIGKTALVQGFLDRLQHVPGLWLATGRCQEQYGAGEAYLPVLEALGRLYRGAGGGRLRELLRRQAPTWLIQMPALVDADDRERLKLQVLGATGERMLREMAEAIEVLTVAAPLVLVLEDLHWSDYSTLDLVASLSRRREPARLLLIGTYRPGEVMLSHHPLKGVVQDLRVRGRCEALPLEFLREKDIEDYLETRLPGAALPAALSRAIHRRTDGNPLFMVNVVDYLVGRRLIGPSGIEGDTDRVIEKLRGGVPESLRQMIEKQIDRLDPEEQRLLEAASVAGPEFPTVAVAAGLSAATLAVEETCENLVRRGLVLRSTGAATLPDGTVAARYGFIHALYQSVLYHRIPLARRLRLHRRIGERGAQVYGERVGEIAAELAVHFEEGRDDRRAIVFLIKAADNAARRHANREAAALLTRAFDRVTRVPEESERQSCRLEILERLGTVRRSMGDVRGAAADFEALVTWAREHDQPEREARALFYLGSALSWFDRPAFHAAAVRAAGLSRRLQDRLLKAHTRGYAGYWNLLLGGYAEADARASATAVRAAREAKDLALLSQHVGRLSYFQAMRSEYDEAARNAREGMDRALETADGFDYLLSQFFLAWTLLHAGRWGEMRSVVQEGIQSAERNGHHLWAALLRAELSLLHQQIFDFGPAVELSSLALRQAREARHAHSETVSLVLLAAAHHGLGQTARAARCFAAAGDRTDRAAALMDRNWLLPLGLSSAEYHLERGEPGLAREEAQGMRLLASRSGERTYLALAHWILARIALQRRRWRAAEVELGRGRRILRGAHAPLAVWRIEAAAVALDQARGRRDDAARHREQAAAVLRRLADELGQDSRERQAFLAAAPVRDLVRGGPLRSIASGASAGAGAVIAGHGCDRPDRPLRAYGRPRLGCVGLPR